jgi:hypothetical protein
MYVCMHVCMSAFNLTAYIFYFFFKVLSFESSLSYTFRDLDEMGNSNDDSSKVALTSNSLPAVNYF